MEEYYKNAETNLVTMKQKMRPRNGKYCYWDSLCWVDMEFLAFLLF